MAVRRERVLLELEDRFTKGVMGAAAATAALNRELKSLSGQSVQTSRATANISRDVDRIGTSANRADGSINQLTGRLRLLADVASILGPALIPLGGVGLAGVAGLAQQMGFAAVAGGVLIGSLQGVGDALKAANEYAIDPSNENLEKLRETFAAISPAARAFVFELREMGPALKSIRDAGAEALIPGLTESLDDLERLAPKVEAIFESIGSALGGIAADSAESLASDRWTEFFDFISTEAPRSLVELSQIVGNLTHGMAELWMAFGPMNNDFSSWMVDVADGFDGWAAGLAETEGFANLVDYIRTTGPQAADTLGAIGNMFVQIVQASAPIAGPVLAGLEAVADVVSTIADSDLGTPIMAGVAALALFNRAAAMSKTLMGTKGGGLLAGQFSGTGVSSIKAVRGDLAAMSTEYGRASKAQSVFMSGLSGTTGAAQRTRATFGGMAKDAGKASAAVAGLAIATSGLGGGLGVTNTASLALMGSMAGPWGAAIGGGVGLMLDFAHASDMATDAQTTLEGAVGAAGGSIEALSAAVSSGRDVLDGYMDSQSLLANVWQGGDSLLTGESAFHSLTEAQSQAEERAKSMRTTYEVLGVTMGETFTDSLGRNLIPSLTELDQIAERAAPAMAALRITTDDLLDMDTTQLQAAGAEIVAWNSHADSAAGRTEVLNGALVDLDSGLVSTAASASAFGDALDALLGPGMNVSAATDAWNAGLDDLADSLHGSSRALKGQTEGARQNRAVIRDRVGDLAATIKAEAAAGAGSKRLTRLLKDGRKTLLDVGTAAGLSRSELREYANQLGLTPKMVKTLIEAQAGAAKSAIADVINGLNAVDGRRAVAEIVTNRITNFVNKVLPGRVFESDGGVLDFYANGGMREDHTAQIAPAGAWRVWAEPETGGEAYIPLAPSKRERSIDIWEKTGSRLGVKYERFASGGFAGLADPSQIATRGEDVAARIELMQFRKQIKDLQRDLRADGKDKLKGLNRQIAQAEMIQARMAMRAAQNEPDRARREAAMEALAERQAAEKERREADLANQLKSLGEYLEANSEILGKATSTYEAALSKAEQAGQASVAGFQTGLFESSGNVWGSGAGGGPSSNLDSDIAGLQARISLTAQLAAAGLSGDALAAVLAEAQGVGGNAQIQAVLNNGTAGSLQARFEQRAALSAQASGLASGLTYGGEVSQAAEALRAAQESNAAIVAEVAITNAKMDALTAAVTLVPAATGAATGSAVNAASVSGWRDRSNKSKPRGKRGAR